MTPERWKLISSVLDAALRIAPNKRGAFLAQACVGDEALRLEIEALIAEDVRTDGSPKSRPLAADPANAGRNCGDSNSSDTETALQGKLIRGRFAVRAKLGAGGMGEVYLAEDTKLKRRVALKRLPAAVRSDERYRKRLLQEARRASAISDPSIAQVYDVLEEDGETFLLLEFIEGTTLRQRLASPLPAEEFLGIAVQCAGAVAAAHQKGVLHCDIKPENIMLTPAGQVKILDFGIAKWLPVAGTGNITESIEIPVWAGTPAYMAPEVLAGSPPSPQSDVYSLGVTFYEVLTGRRSSPMSFAMAADANDPTADHAPLRREIGIVVAKMVQPNPAQRYADAAGVFQDLRSLQESGSREWPAKQALAGRLGRRHAFALAGILASIFLVWAAMAQLRPRLIRALHPVPAQRQVAVLPFSIAGAEAETKAFADGLSDILSAKLTQLTERPQLQVVPVSEVRARHVTTPAEARREFGVNLVITGSWQQAGGRIHVVPVLIDATKNRQLRADEFETASSDPLGLEAEVVAGILRMLEIELAPAEQQSFRAGDQVEPDAYTHYLRGRGYLEELEKPENIDSAIAEFDHALQHNSSYAPALAGLGQAYWRKYDATHEREWSTLAKSNCERAVEVAETESAGHACLGQVLQGTGDYQRAVEQYRRALEIEPTNDVAITGMASACASLGNANEAEATYAKAIALRPNYWLGYNSLGRFYVAHGRYQEAEAMFKRVVSIAPDSFRGWSNLGGTEVHEGRYSEAIQLLQRSISIRPTYGAYSNLATAFFELRRFGEAIQAYNQALHIDDRDYRVWGNLGDAESYSGDKGGCLCGLSKSRGLVHRKASGEPAGCRSAG